MSGLEYLARRQRPCWWCFRKLHENASFALLLVGRCSRSVSPSLLLGKGKHFSVRFPAPTRPNATGRVLPLSRRVDTVSMLSVMNNQLNTLARRYQAVVHKHLIVAMASSSKEIVLSPIKRCECNHSGNSIITLRYFFVQSPHCGDILTAHHSPFVVHLFDEFLTKVVAVCSSWEGDYAGFRKSFL